MPRTGSFDSPDSTRSQTETSAGSSAEAANKGASEIIAEVSHELRLPIANIKLLVETLLDGASDDKEVCARMLRRAQQEVDRLQALVSDLLSMEQVHQSRPHLSCQWIHLNERALYATESVATMAMSKGVEVKVLVAPSCKIYANLEQLDQVLLNLVENAVKFTPQGGQVTVSSGPESNCFTVSDTGIGIAESEIPKIFQRFYRVDRSKSKGSTGLGLSIVKNIAELHGARIEVESKEGKGSSFKIEFPDPDSKSR